MIRLLNTAVARIQDAQAAMPSDLDGMACALGDLDELLGVLSSYTTRLSSAVESLHDPHRGRCGQWMLDVRSNGSRPGTR